MRHSFALLFLLLLLAGCKTQPSVPPVDIGEEQAYAAFERLAGINLNFNSVIPADSLIRESHRIETLARNAGNTAHEFKAGQVQVNSYGLSGSFGLAAGKAQRLLDKARTLDSPIALGLAVQAIGDAYMHSGRFDQADSLFNEAAPLFTRHGNPVLRIQLLLQRLHVYANQDRVSDAVRTISLVRTLLEENPELPGGDVYARMLTYYEASEAIQDRDTTVAARVFGEIRRRHPADGLFEEWIRSIEFRYCMLTEDYDRALAYNDTMLLSLQGANAFARRDVLQARADLFEKTNRVEDACDTYSRISVLADSLYAQQYISQVDSLHVIFWVDHLLTENVNRRNGLYAKILSGLLAVVLITCVVFLLIRRKNRQIEASRLALLAMREASGDSIRTKSLFLSNMSHELRTPLNAIVGFSAILTGEEPVDDETRRQCSEYVRQNADLLLKLIGDVVDFSGLQGASIRFSYAPCDVVALCRNVLKTVDNVKRTQAAMHFETGLETLVLNTDKNRLQQVLINLLVNATKFTTEGDITLTLRVDEGRDEAVFSVRDTGCGIPLEKQPRIFERFEKLHEGVQGAGLGLSICKLIVEHSGGRIWIDSTYTRGACFVFTHPLHFTPKEPQA